MSRRFFLLGSAYEQQENKFKATAYYKQALKTNPECYEAFEKLTQNFLIIDHEKIELVQSLKLDAKQMWIRDYYLSKIEKKLVKANGIVRL